MNNFKAYYKVFSVLFLSFFFLFLATLQKDDKSLSPRELQFAEKPS